jgi:hypothetical protein
VCGGHVDGQLIKIDTDILEMQPQERWCQAGLIENDCLMGEAKMSNQFLSNVK